VNSVNYAIIFAKLCIVVAFWLPIIFIYLSIIFIFIHRNKTIEIIHLYSKTYKQQA